MQPIVFQKGKNKKFKIYISKNINVYGEGHSEEEAIENFYFSLESWAKECKDDFESWFSKNNESITNLLGKPLFFNEVDKDI